jgi:hypothetical protein
MASKLREPPDMPSHMDLGPFKVGFPVPPLPLPREGASWGRAAAPPWGRRRKVLIRNSRGPMDAAVGAMSAASGLSAPKRSRRCCNGPLCALAIKACQSKCEKVVAEPGFGCSRRQCPPLRLGNSASCYACTGAGGVERSRRQTRSRRVAGCLCAARGVVLCGVHMACKPHTYINTS